MNLGQLKTRLQARGYGADTPDEQTELLNVAYEDLLSRERWPFLEATDTATFTADQAYLDIASTITDLGVVDAVRLTDAAGVPITVEPIRDQEMRELLHQSSDSSTPAVWSYYSDLLWVYPTPNQAYVAQVDYIKTVDALSADSDTTVVPDQFDDALVLGALVEIAQRERDWSAHDRAQTRYEKRLYEMRKYFGLGNRQGTSTVPKSGFYQRLQHRFV